MENVHWHPIGNLQWVEDKWSEDEPKFVRRTDRSVIHETSHPITKRTTPHMTWSVLLNTFSVWCFFLTDRFLCTCFCSSTGTAGTKHSSSEKPTHVYENTMFPTPTPTVTMWNFRAVETNTNTDWTLVLCNPPPRYRCILQRAGEFTVAKKKKKYKKIPNMFTSHQLRLFCFFQQELQEYESCQTSLTVIKDVWR